MIIALAAVGFKNGDITYNKDRILDIIRDYGSRADFILFGETFLQGFDALTWNYEKDKSIAVTVSDPVISKISEATSDNNVAVSFGFIEKDGDSLFSSQLTIGSDGEVVDLFRRVSEGWKEPCADDHYREGVNFHVFEYNGRRFAIGLCGDLWDDENARKMNALSADIILWPVYTDFNFNEWNNTVKYEYADQAALCGRKVLYVNSVCLDKEEYETARGGAAFFADGKIRSETPSGNESILLVDLNEEHYI